jgi:hypothetical protein
MKPMSSCKCENPTDLRFTGEVHQEQSKDVEVRLRCAECGGKITYAPAAWMANIPGLELDDLRNGRCLPEHKQKEITIDLY